MPHFSIVYADAAKDDITDIAGYIDEKAGAIVAARFIDRIIATVESLSRMPHRHRERDELGAGLRVIGFRRYLIFYRIDGNVVSIIRVLHGARNITAKLLSE